MVHSRGVEWEAKKRRKVDLISFDTVIKLKDVIPRATVIFPFTYTHFKPCNLVRKCTHCFNSTAFDNTTSESRFARLLMEKSEFRIFYIVWPIWLFLIIVSYNRHCRFLMNFASNKQQKPSLVLRGYTLCGIRGQNVAFFFLKKDVFLMK